MEGSAELVSYAQDDLWLTFRLFPKKGDICIDRIRFIYSKSRFLLLAPVGLMFLSLE
jgi:hypothetical protein